MPLVSGGLLFAWWRGALSRRTWVIAIALQAILVISGLAALRTGGQDEERVERIVPGAAIEAHEEAAEAMIWVAAGVLLLTAAAMVPRERAGLGVAAVAVAGTVAVLGLGIRTGEAGGRLVYQHGAAAAYAPSPGGGAAPGPAPGGDRDDDD